MGTVPREQQVSPEDKALLAQSLPFMELSKNAYDTAGAQAPVGWKLAGASSPRPHVEGFYARVYERMDDNGQLQYAVAFRGTDSIRDMGNICADAKIALLKLPRQYEKGVKFVRDFCREKNISPSDMTYTGHSLGGYLAATVGETFGSKNIWTFNAPAPDVMTWQKVERHKERDVSAAPGQGWVQIRSRVDLISKWGYYSRAKTISIQTAVESHTIDSLRSAATRIVSGLPPLPSVRRASRGLLSCAFNAVARVSEAIATSRTMGWLIKSFMVVGHNPLRIPLLVCYNRKPARALSPQLA